MCERGSTSLVWLQRGDLLGQAVSVDSCLAEIIQALNDGGVKTTGSCCGHGEKPGMIALEDGRMILVVGWPEEKKVLQDLIKALPWPAP